MGGGGVLAFSKLRLSRLGLLVPHSRSRVGRTSWGIGASHPRRVHRAHSTSRAPCSSSCSPTRASTHRARYLHTWSFGTRSTPRRLSCKAALQPCCPPLGMCHSRGTARGPFRGNPRPSARYTFVPSRLATPHRLWFCTAPAGVEVATGLEAAALV